MVLTVLGLGIRVIKFLLRVLFNGFFFRMCVRVSSRIGLMKDYFYIKNFFVKLLRSGDFLLGNVLSAGFSFFSVNGFFINFFFCILSLVGSI